MMLRETYSRRMSGTSATGRFVLAALLLGVLSAVPAQAVTVTKASDVCASNADPCIVSSVLDIPNGLCTDTKTACTTNAECVLPGWCELGKAVFDFGVREVQVTGAGQFNFGTSSGDILCGDFTASTTNPAIDAAGIEEGGTDSGTVKLFARRKCSTGGGAAPACLTNNDCKAGTCDKRRCSLRPAKTCTSNENCQVGTCVQAGLKKHCTIDTTIQCATNADCDLGTCPAQLTCSNRVTDPRNCTTNTDCDFGNCSVGTASINMGGPIVGNSEFPAFLDFRASDNISITKTVNLAGTTADSDGGELSVDATFGSISVTGKITATSGGFSTGGDVSLYAGTDVSVSEDIDVTGGDYDGGTIDFDAGRDVNLTRSILGNAGSGAGYGGEFLVVAGRDLTLSGVSSANKSSLETSGHANLINEAGDGGAQDLSAERNLVLNVNTRIITNGAAPNAIGGDVALDASGNITFNGDVTAKALGANGSGGSLGAFASGTATAGATATVDVTGGSDDAGEMQIFSGGDLSFAGLADLGASNGGVGGTATLDSDASMNVSGTVRITSGDDGSIDLSACYVTLTGTGKLDSSLTSSDNSIEADETIRLNTGSLMKTGPLGTNKLKYRTAAKPPVVNGTVSPAPQLIINPNLTGCVVCGNGILDGAESCEDGNTANGDGCNSQCQNEACVAQTAPKIPCTMDAQCGARTCEAGFCFPWNLCEDGDVCTTDTCNDAQDTCVHAAKNCADAHACTADSCNPADGECQHTPNDAACADSNVCTDEICSALSGCVVTANTDGCDDGVECTTGDHCSNMACIGTPGEGCGFCGDLVKDPNEACDDGNATYAQGEYCGLNCDVLVPCGRPTAATGTPKSSDAQYVLRVAVGVATCSRRVCDVDNSGTIVATDAQRLLRKAVGQDVVLNCPTTGQ